MLLEYKFFEPYFYAMDIPDWGTSLVHCLALGDQATVVLDTGHHAPGTNIEFIVMQLLRAGRLGAFDFNSRNYADDDLIVGSADPFQLFRIMNEIVGDDALRPESGVNFMLDQCHNIEPKIPGQIRSVMNVQEATAKALLVDREALAAAQQAGDVLGANDVLMDAYNTDVRPLLAELRESQGLDADPYAAYAALRLPGAHRHASASAASRPAGAPDPPLRTDAPLRPASTTPKDLERDEPRGQRPARPQQPARRGPAQHQLRRRQHLRQGHRDRPGHRAAGRAALGQGLRRRPRHADRAAASPCCGSTGCARWSTSTRASTARTRWSPRSTTACTAAAAPRRRSTPPCTAWSGRAHVDHLHPDSGIALATAADGEALTRECFGDRVVWVPWRRPGFQLGLDIAEIAEKNPQAIGCILGGHGVTAWGETSEQCEANSLEIIRTAERFLAERGTAEPFGAGRCPATRRCPTAERRLRAAALAPVIRGLASHRQAAGRALHRHRRRPRLPRPRRSTRRLAALGTSLPRPLPAHQGAAAGRRPAGRPRRSRTSSRG